MADDIGVLVAQVVADTQQFRTEMRSLAAQVTSNTAQINARLASVQKSSASLASAFSLVTRVAGLFGVAFSAAAMIRFTAGTINAAAQLHNLSNRLNISVESMSELQYVAKVSDIELGVFTQSLQAMARTFGQAAKGGLEAQRVFESVGLNWQMLSSMSVDQQFEAVAEALSRVEDEAQRVAFAQQLLGRGGVQLLQAFEDGAAGVQKLRQELRDMGGVTTAETAKAADDAKDAMDRLKGAAGSLTNELVNVLAPGLTQTTNMLREFMFPSASSQGAEFDAYGDKVAEMVERVTLLRKTLAHELDLTVGGGGNFLTRSDFFQEWVGMGHKIDPEETKRQLAAAMAELEELRTKWLASQKDPAGTKKPGDVAGVGTAGAMVDTNLLAGQEDVQMQTGALQERLAAMQEFAAIQEEFEQRELQSATDVAEASMQIREQQRIFEEEQLDKELQSATDAAEARLEVVKHHAEQEMAMRQLVTDSAIGLLQALGAKHRGAAIAALAIQKALAVKEIFVQSQVGAARAIAELGPIAGPPAAAAILAKGKISAALVAATGLVEAGQLSSGGTVSTRGTSANPLITRPGSSVPTSTGGIAGTARERGVQVIFQGDVFGWDDTMRRKIVSSLRDLIDNRDVVIFGPNSRQAAEILGR